MFKRLITLILCLFALNWLMAQVSPVSTLEYFIDTDNGYGTGTLIESINQTNTQLDFNVDISGLDEGMHFFYVRALNDTGWSQTFNKPFLKVSAVSFPDITRLEYFFDSAS